MQQRKLESVADCCCGRDRHHSDGFYKGLCRLRGDLSLPASATTFRRRAILLCSNDGAASIPKFGPEIKNRCTQERVNGENLASILKSGPEIKNRCTQECINRQNTTSIPKSGPEIKNRCTQEGLNREIPTSIPKSGPEIKNRCTQERVNGENLASILKSGLEIKNRCSTRLKNRCSTMESALCRGRGMPDGQAESDAGALSLPAGKLGLGLCSDQPLLRVGVDRCLDYFKFREGFFE